MKEFVEKLIERLEELKEDAINEDCPVVPNSEDCEMEYSCASCHLTAAIRIVEELAEEYNHVSNDMMITELVEKLRTYANGYNTPPYGREIEGTKELLKQAADMIEEYINTSTDISIEQFDLSRQIADDLNAVLEEAKSMGCKDVKYFHNIPLKNVETVIKALRAYKSNVSGNLTGWIPVEERLPETDDYILLSFENFTIPDIGRYEEGESGGAFYIGDDDKNCTSYHLFVNAWMELPEAYKPEEQKKIPTDHYEERFNRVM